LQVGAELGHDLSTWRPGSRVVVSEFGGRRFLRYLDTVSVPGGRGFGKLVGDPAD